MEGWVQALSAVEVVGAAEEGRRVETLFTAVVVVGVDVDEGLKTLSATEVVIGA